jgi:uncharacterized OsmC-like protein
VNSSIILEVDTLRYSIEFDPYLSSCPVRFVIVLLREKLPMDLDELRRRQGPLKERYRNDPSSAQKQLHACATLVPDGVSCRVDTFLGSSLAGLHLATGGDGDEACSADMLLQSLVACAGVTLAAVAKAMGIPIRSGTLTAKGDLDFRGTLGVSKEVPVGFSAIKLNIEIDADVSPEQLANLLRLTERYCVIYQTLRTPALLSSEINRSQSS